MIYVLLIFLFLSLGFLFTSLSGAPWVPTRSFDVENVLDDVKLKKGQLFIELGCGDGRLLRAASRRGATAIGYELNPLLWFIAWVRSLSDTNVSIRFVNFWSVDLNKADVVMAFLVPRTMPRLDKKAAKELKKSARLVSYIFPIEGKKPLSKHKSWYVYQY